MKLTTSITKNKKHISANFNSKAYNSKKMAGSKTNKELKTFKFKENYMRDVRAICTLKESVGNLRVKCFVSQRINHILDRLVITK